MAAEVLENHSEDLVLEPISLSDVKKNAVDLENEDSHHSPDGTDGVKYFSVAMGMAGTKRKREASTSSASSAIHQKHLQHWRHAILKARCHVDPWEKFHLDEYPTEKALRHRYNALKKEWVVDEVVVKMEPKSFAHGAMRECFRIKKLSNFSHNMDWRRDCNNAVAKRYMNPVDRNIYFEEVKLQMDAKLWGEEYNRHHPPKKVDICMMAIIEFIDRPEKPLYHVENFIEGHYVKYNSNSGFVLDDDTHRQTPQAFSHFTFERSGHELIVVDIQGVGDLYTDPQIHTVSGKEYGDGNLGTRGMALFFHSHICNSICHGLGLSQFDLAPSEMTALTQHQRPGSCPGTVAKGNEDICLLPSEYERTHLHEFLRMRSSSSVGSCSSLSESIGEWTADPDEDPEGTNDSDGGGIRLRTRFDSGVGDSLPSPTNGVPQNGNGTYQNAILYNGQNGGSASQSRPFRRQRMVSETGSGTITDEADRLAFRQLVERKSRPSCVMAEMEARKKLHLEDEDGMALGHRTGGSVLGQIHLDLAKYHELQRFTQPGVEGYDHEAALYHLRHAADCGHLEAIITMARIALQLPHDILPDLTLEPSDSNVDMALDYMLVAASAGDRAAMVYLAKAYDTGEGLGSRSRSWSEAASWYSKAIEMETGDEEGNYDGTMDDPTYQLIGRQAEMYRDGGFGLEIDYSKAAELFTEAADAAMAAMKGRLANKYYALAEEMNSLLEE